MCTWLVIQVLCGYKTVLFNVFRPDPFEERHPSRVDSDCQFGLILKAYFKKDSLVQEVLNNYMKDNYFTRAGLDQSSFNLNIAACRLVLDIVPGLEIGVLKDTEGDGNLLYACNNIFEKV